LLSHEITTLSLSKSNRKSTTIDPQVVIFILLLSPSQLKLPLVLSLLFPLALPLTNSLYSTFRYTTPLLNSPKLSVDQSSLNPPFTTRFESPLLLYTSNYPSHNYCSNSSHKNFFSHPQKTAIPRTFVK
jgi:hypothetical protein